MGMSNYGFFKKGEKAKCGVCGKEERIDEELYRELGGVWTCGECMKRGAKTVKG